MIIYIFLVFNVVFFSNIGNKIVNQLDLSSYTEIINAIQTVVIDQFIAFKKNRKKRTKIKKISIIG